MTVTEPPSVTYPGGSGGAGGPANWELGQHTAPNVGGQLDALGIAADEFVGVLVRRPDGTMSAQVAARDDVQGIVASAAGDVWVGTNPVAGPARLGARGVEADVTRLAAVYADLDVKAGACASLEAAHAIVDDVSALIGERPTYVTFSGGGLQPVWVVEDCKPDVGRVLLKRFGRLVRAVADTRGATVDSVFDLARVLRAWGTRNHKYGDPIEVALIEDTGGPIDPDTIAERLDECGIAVEDGDDGLASDVVVADDDWRFAADGCGYSVTTIKGWLDEPVTERHPWLLRCLVRLECMRRNQCLTRDQYGAAARSLENRFVSLLGSQEPRRSPHRFEVRDLRLEAISRAARKSAAELETELGSHVHLMAARMADVAAVVSVDPVADDRPAESPTGPGIANLIELEGGFWRSRESLAAIYRVALVRMCSPWAVLAACVARALAVVPPKVTLPPLVGGRGSLNWFGVIAAPSGGGKGSALAVGRELVGEQVCVRNLGSGEGIVAAFTGPKGDRLQESILFNVDEVDSLGALKGRTGSTLMSAVRSGFAGETLGFSYATAGKGHHVEAHSYRMTLLCSVQPGRAATLFEDAAGGTPQRFMWFPGIDPRISRQYRDEWGWQPTPALALPDRKLWTYPREIILPAEAEDTIYRNRELQGRGQIDAIDGHALFAREKFAYALAVLDGRAQMTSEDWELSGIAATVSDATRTWVAQGMEDAERSDARRRGERRGWESAAADETRAAEDQMRIDRVAAYVFRRLGDSKAFEAGGVLWTDLREKLPQSKDRPLLRNVLTRLEVEGVVSVVSEGRTERWSMATQR